MEEKHCFWEEYQKIINEKRLIREKIGKLLSKISNTNKDDERASAINNITLLVIEYADESKIARKMLNEYKTHKKENK